MKKELTPLTRFWMALNYKENKRHSEVEDAYTIAMHGAEYHPIDTRFCMVYYPDTGWYLLEASGSAIVNAIECGSME